MAWLSSRPPFPRTLREGDLRLAPAFGSRRPMKNGSQRVQSHQGSSLRASSGAQILLLRLGWHFKLDCCRRTKTNEPQRLARACRRLLLLFFDGIGGGMFRVSFSIRNRSCVAALAARLFTIRREIVNAIANATTSMMPLARLIILQLRMGATAPKHTLRRFYRNCPLALSHAAFRSI